MLNFDQVWVQVLRKETLPSLNSVFSIIQAEESQRSVMLDSQSIEGLTMSSSRSSNGTGKNIAEKPVKYTAKPKLESFKPNN